MLLGANLIYFTSLGDPWRVDAGARRAAVGQGDGGVAIVLWLGVVYFGRMLPYLGGAY